ncbi:MAG TPA: RNA chaperone Hfq [Tissierellia bacterium]|nr:RNA chaperone Hfq [Tissierellia bacterium]
MRSNVNLQDAFLNKVRKDRMMITVYLVSGYQFRGLVKGFDNYTVVIDSDGTQQMIYKHAISTLVPARPINFMEDIDKDDAV